MEMTIKTKRQRNAGSTNPKKNPAMRRIRSREERQHVPLFALTPKHDAFGKPIPGKFVRYWGGRKPSKYDPATEDAKRAAKKAA